jgi:hypothetical protein
VIDAAGQRGVALGRWAGGEGRNRGGEGRGPRVGPGALS